MADQKLTKEQIDLLENFPVDPCVECDLGPGCSCQERTDYKDKWSKLRELGLDDVAYDIIKIKDYKKKIKRFQSEINVLEKNNAEILKQLSLSVLNV